MSTNDDNNSDKKRLADVSRNRGFIRQRITKLVNKISDEVPNVSHSGKSLHLEKCITLKKKIQDLDEEIFEINISLNTNDLELGEEETRAEAYIEMLDDAILKLESLPTQNLAGVGSSGISVEGNTPSVVQNKLKLPQVPLPEFSNRKGENLRNFFLSFESIIDKHRLSSFEKYVYLSKQLSNAPKILVDSLDIEDKLYEKAKELLEQAFDNSERSKSDIINRLTKLKLQNNSDPYPFIGEMRSLISSIKTLKITVDDFVQYFVWTGLNGNFQTHLTNITNKCKPNLDDINNNLFEATDRYLREINENSHRTDRNKPSSSSFKQEANSMAINVKQTEKSKIIVKQAGKSKIFCVLCASDKKRNDHYLKDCLIYRSPKNKFDKLRSIKACTKCSFANHETNACKFIFKSNCQYCDQAHMTYLCLKSHQKVSSNTVSTEYPNEVLDATSSSLFIEASQMSLNNSMILPTLTAQVCDGTAIYNVRAFKDGGCQQTFIDGALAENLGLPIMDQNIILTVHGFNSSKQVRTKKVAFTLKFGSKTFRHTALCVDNIRTKFSIAGLGKIVSEFVSQGFNLADNEYNKDSSGSVDNIDIILGTDTDHMIPMTYKTYGDVSDPDNLSSYIETPFGVIFSGDLSKMAKNLPFLQNKNEYHVINTCVATKATPQTVGFSPEVDPELIGTPERVVEISTDFSLPGGDTCTALHEVQVNPAEGEGADGSPCILPPGAPIGESSAEGEEPDACIVRNISCSSKGMIPRRESPLNGEQEFIPTDDITYHNYDTRCYFISTNDENISFENELGDIDDLKSNESLLGKYNYTMNVGDDCDTEIESDTNKKLIEFVLNNTRYDADGRLIMPLTWNSKNSHLLSNNYGISIKILESNVSKLKKNPDHIKLYNNVFKEQEDLGVIEKIDNLDQFLQDHPESSFLPHMGIFKMSRETSKCRVVFLSNMFEKRNNGISHNMAMLPGPNLNHKISTAVILHRFDKYLVIFDLKKAFLQIKLNQCDQNRLCFLWYKNVEKNDFTIVGYRNLRLSFGLRCSPSILMLGLYRILMLNESGDQKLDDIKKAIYNGIYMDNGSYTSDSEVELVEAFKRLDDIFLPHKFELQQHCSNSPALQQIIEAECDSPTASEEVKFFGMCWNTIDDSLGPFKIELDIRANSKRKILSSINAIYDIYNIYAPILLRAKLFLQSLQANSDITWDSTLPDHLCNEWTKIVLQANSTPAINISRYIGSRNSNYQLIAFTDASKDAYGILIYIKDIDSGKVSYLSAIQRLVSTGAKSKSIPSKEFQALTFGVQALHDMYLSLSGETVVSPINVMSMLLFSDSMVCLHWLEKSTVYFEKLQSVSVFVKNRLRKIEEICNKTPITFHHIAGEINPSDYLTRPTSHKRLNISNYLEGPSFLSGDISEMNSDIIVRIPNPRCIPTDEVPDEVEGINTHECISMSTSSEPLENVKNHLIPLDRYSDFKLIARILTKVFKFVSILKCKIGKTDCISDDRELHEKAVAHLISVEQQVHYPEVFYYLSCKKKYNHEIPPIINRFNLYRDRNGILRIKSKFEKNDCVNPIILPGKSILTSLIIRSTHNELSHSGFYSVVRALRQKFWIQKYFTAVNKVLKSCITCKKIHERPIKLNQNSYRSFRSDPPKKPFKSVVLDYIGPFNVKLEGKPLKVYILAITCVWSRATNLIVCNSANVRDFLRAIQLHSYEYGLFQSCLSDMGSQITAGSNLIQSFLSDHESKSFLSSNGISELTFQHYAKGNSSLGSLIESLVKQIKYLIFKSIKSIILDYFEFQFIVAKTTHLINKRPVAFRDGLRSLGPDEIPVSITPELLIKGYECTAINIIPGLQPVEDEYCSNIKDSDMLNSEHGKLSKVRERLVDQYNSEFLSNLIYQAVDQPDRYKHVKTKNLQSGDIVLLVEKFSKRYHYPMGRVVSVDTNSLGEVTAAKVMKGDTRETVYRHATSLIRLLSDESVPPNEDMVNNSIDEEYPANTASEIGGHGRAPSTRQAAQRCREKIRKMTKD